MKRAGVILAILAIIVGSCAVSVLTLFHQSIRLDESQSLWMATKSFNQIFYLIGQDVHVPLYETILHIWIQIFGTSVIYARALSLFFYACTIPVLYLLYRQVTSRSIALVSVLIYSFSPFMLWYSSEARMYTLFTLTSAINSYYFLKFLRSDGTRAKVGLFFSTLVGFYTHYFFACFILCQAIYIYGYSLRELSQTGFRKELLIRAFFTERVKTYISIIVLAALFFLTWIIYFISLGAAANTQPLIAPPTTYNIFLTFLNFLFGFQSQRIQTIAVSLWPLIVMSFFFVFTQGYRQKTRYMGYFVIMSFLPIALAYGVSYIRPVFLSRYLIFTIPSLYLLVAWTLMSYQRRVSTVLVMAFFVMMLGLLMYQNIVADVSVKEDYSTVTDYLSRTTTGSDIIAVTPPFTLYPIEYSYTGRAGITTIPPWDRYRQTRIPAFSVTQFQKQIKSYSSYDSVYIVYSYDQGYESKIKDYMEHHYKRLSKKTFSPGLEVYAYKLRY